MINILISSEHTGRMSEIVRLVTDSGSYTTTRMQGAPSTLLERGDSLDVFDVLIIDASSLEHAELPAVDMLIHRYPRLTCILLLPEASPDVLIAAMRAGFRDVLNWPLDPRALGDALKRAIAQRVMDQRHETHFVSFISCKGGAGTSFIAANVGHAISTLHDKRVLLVDLTQQFGDAAFLVSDQTPPSTLPQMCAQIGRMDAAFLEASLTHVSPRFHVLAGAGDPLKALDIHEEQLEWILGVAAPRYDVVLFDLGQSINALSIVALDRSAEIHMVLQASMPYVRAARRLQEILVSLAYPADQLRVLVNRHRRQDERVRSVLEQVLGKRPSHLIPDDPQVAYDAVNLGEPVLKTARNSPLAHSLQTLAQNIANHSAGVATADKRGEPMLAKLFGHIGASRQPKVS
ncbi:pilus assembly protein [Caballeronia mineralivorans PML1(12)]|uniref:Pilus assembly protein n=1 Tax=Caballeronia mineralivorans PML1(12) TaxID=908627 RepID=A0A0J1FUJ7_9BURK|nr:AAA family ATPase [Caballeronia mineralivorans]KLU23508.1 pilus assembly protein [Caballeronia mineralivorans PML1(12)]